MNAAIHDMLPGPRQLVWQVGRILGVSVLIGTFLFHVWTGVDQLPEHWPRFLWNVYYTLIYTTIIITSLQATVRLLKARVPLRSRRAVAIHVGVVSGVAVGAYGLATGLCRALHPSFDVSGSVLLVTAAVAFGVTLIWTAFTYMNAFYRRLREAEAAQYEARLAALRAQINPHFLFNAFNSIAALIRTRPGEAESVVEDLSTLFRYALRASKDGGMATVGRELEATRRYLRVEKARFRDRLSVQVDVPETLRPTSLPGMTLQPLVENAVQHGVGETRDGCTVAIEARRTDDRLVLRVTDTGPGFDTTDLDAVLDGGTGLANVRERLELFFGAAAQMQLLPQGVELRVPVQEPTEERPRSTVETTVTE